ncbi:MAG: hypothetical protein ACLU8C_09650 [Lacrimispora saccharolytica]|nr:hypothetical protein [Lacrimispora saccharolytica]MBS6705217.1 hypothetical protein [Lachnospiraceae bacterium]
MKNGESEEYRLVIEGNALYEVDMECVRCRESRRKAAEEECKKARQKNNPGKDPEKPGKQQESESHQNQHKE